MKTRARKIIAAISLVVNIAMVAVVYFATVNELLGVAILALALSKWRIFAARPRFWGRNLVNGACDISFGASVIALMHFYQANIEVVYGLTGLLGIWQVGIKVLRSQWAVGLQGSLCLAVSQVAIWTYYPEIFSFGLPAVALAAISAFVSSYHILRQNEQFEGRAVLFSMVWAVLFAQVAWLNWLWNIQYVIEPIEFYVPQAAVLAVLTGYYLYTIASINKRRKIDQQRIFTAQTLFFVVLAGFIIAFSNWNAIIS